jgi:hypothetical protein
MDDPVVATRLSPATHKRLKAEARKHRTSVSKVLRVALENHLGITGEVA